MTPAKKPRKAAPKPRKKTKPTPEPDWIAGAVSKPGSFTAQAKVAGMSTQEYARKKKHAPGKTGKRARLALTFAKMAKKGSK